MSRRLGKLRCWWYGHEASMHPSGDPDLDYCIYCNESVPRMAARSPEVWEKYRHLRRGTEKVPTEQELQQEDRYNEVLIALKNLRRGEYE